MSHDADVTEAVDQVLEETRPREKYSNKVAESALSACLELSKIGTREKDARRRLVGLIAFLREGLSEYQAELDVIATTWADRDDNGEIKISTSDDGKTTRMIMRNEAEAQLATNDLGRKRIKATGDIPRGFSLEELDKYFTTLKMSERVPAVPAETAARLGPWLEKDESATKTRNT